MVLAELNSLCSFQGEAWVHVPEQRLLVEPNFD